MQAWFQKRHIVWIVLSAVIVGIWLRHQAIEHAEKDESPQAPPLLVVHEGISYRYDEQGNSHMKLSAPLTHYYQDARGTEFTQPRLHHQQGETHTHIRADYAQQNEAGTELHLENNVFAERQNGEDSTTRFEFSTDKMLYRIDKNQAESDTPVLIRSADSTTHAIGTIWHLNQNLFILKQNVRSYYAPHHNF